LARLDRIYSPATVLKVEKYTFGVGDRFAHQGQAQLRAFLRARAVGIDVYPVWNKSNREHLMIESKPDDVRAEADAAVTALCWNRRYYVDADHIGLKTVDAFIEASDFYTVDVADFAGKTADPDAIEGVVKETRRYARSLSIPGIDRPLEVSPEDLHSAARKFLLAMQEASRIYQYIEAKKGGENFVTEISIDETDTPQNPVELFLILAMIAREGIPVQTIAPKFTGRFNKGVDYEGDLAQFEKEFAEDLSVIAFAVREFRLPETLKLSVHSGSDKFALYPIINRLIKKHEAGLHVKTAGTTWLEEIGGLAESGEEGLVIAKEIYSRSFERFAELTAPYRTVTDIDQSKLPNPKVVAKWSSTEYVSALQHARSRPGYNPHFRQLLHVGFKIAAEMGERFTRALKANEPTISRNVTANLFQNHLLPVFA
jgi:tagaturonate epimerase